MIKKKPSLKTHQVCSQCHPLSFCGGDGGGDVDGGNGDGKPQGCECQYRWSEHDGPQGPR